MPDKLSAEDRSFNLLFIIGKLEEKKSKVEIISGKFKNVFKPKSEIINSLFDIDYVGDLSIPP